MTASILVVDDEPAIQDILTWALSAEGYRVTAAGNGEEALARAERLLAPGGAFVAKIFQGPDVEGLRKRLATRFSEVRTLKPEGSRAESIEIYLGAKCFI